MKKIILLIVSALIFIRAIFAGQPYVLVLGTAQDAGAPQMGCMTPFCKKAWEDRRIRKLVSSIALVDPESGQRWIFDATPDLPEQFQALKKKTGDYSNNLDGIFLTHAHIGHYTGLIYLGRESVNSKSIKVYSMPRMNEMLRMNAPWSQLVDLENIVLAPLEDSRSVWLNGRIKVTPFLVPHRDEFSETVGYRIETADKKLVFIPDIDKWQKWNTGLEEIVRLNDFVLVDGTFYADGEIPRPISEVPHPFVSETVERLKSLPAVERKKVHFIHFNHSNPIIQGDKRIIRSLNKSGFGISYRGQIIML